MAHQSENCRRLATRVTQVDDLSQLANGQDLDTPGVTLLRFPANRRDQDGAGSEEAFRALARFCAGLPDEATICILTTPPDAARLLPFLETALTFQLWIAVKTAPGNHPGVEGQLPERHAALLILTRYRGALRHTKTRIRYTYCPACGKTTKDYGGKKHVYHEYGTLMSDVWRDISGSLDGDIAAIIERLSDLFGLESYQTLQVLDLRGCAELKPRSMSSTVQEARLPLAWEAKGVPLGSQLLNADCLTALQTLPDNSVDFCFADPPYNLQKRYDHWDDALEAREYFAWCDRWLTELARVLKPGRTLTVLNIPLWAVRHYQHLATVLQFQHWIAWEALGFPVRMIMPAHYAILCFSKGTPRPLPGLTTASPSLAEYQALKPLAELYCLRSACLAQRRRSAVSDQGELNDLWHDIHRLKHNSRRVDHPCQLPPMLMRRLLALFTRPGEMVLDCFNGSGTSTLVAHQMERRFLGIELSPQYHQLAQQRHEQVARGEDPFAKQNSVPAAKNSPVERLPKQRYEITKKTLQLDVRRIAQELGRLPTREEVQRLSSYPMAYFERYFISWGEVCAAARTTGMSEWPQPIVGPQPQMQLSLEEP
jgi:site-specific DNA-methyltransferase (adenine-specific)